MAVSEAATSKLFLIISLFPFPGLRLRVTLCVHFELEDGGDAVQTGPCRGCGLVVNGAAVTDRALLHRADTLPDPRCGFSALAHDDTLSFTVQGAVWPDEGPVCADVRRGHAKNRSSGLK